MTPSTNKKLIVACICLAGLAISCVGGLWGINDNLGTASLVIEHAGSSEGQYIAQIDSPDDLRKILSRKLDMLQRMSEVGVLLTSQVQALLIVLAASLLGLFALLLVLLLRSNKQEKLASPNSGI